MFNSWPLLCLTLILIFDGNFIVTLELAPEDSLHHQDKLIICDVFIVDRDAPDVVAQLGFDDQLPAQVQLAVHGTVWPVQLPPLNCPRQVSLHKK